jgi:hypothetical protein
MKTIKKSLAVIGLTAMMLAGGLQVTSPQQASADEACPNYTCQEAYYVMCYEGQSHPCYKVALDVVRICWKGYRPECSN